MVGRAAAKPAGEKAGNEYMVTLALSPQETSFLLFAREQGRIQLSLRSKTEDGKAVAIVPANINTLLEMQLGLKSGGQSETTKPGRHVEVYRGLKRDLIALSEGE
jgi:Flp pilus assembly protein CpaB